MKNIVKLIFTGDLIPADRHHTLGLGAGSRLDIMEALWSEEIQGILQKGDLCVINLEAPLVDDQVPNIKKEFAGRIRVIGQLRESGITHAHIANNHILEHGVKNWNTTITLLNENGIVPVGILENDNSKIVIKEVNNTTVAIAGFNAVHDFSNPGCYAELTEGNVLAALQLPEMKNADIKVLLFHWGDEYIHIPSFEQILLGRKCIDHGAHLIIGHHPHVVQPVEEYNGGLICYSLGNFVFDMSWDRSVRTGMVIEVDVDKKIIASWKAHGVRYDSKPQTHLLRSNWLNKKLISLRKKMKGMEARGENHYNWVYTRTLKLKRFIARLQMKKQLLMQLPRISSTNRKVIFKNLLGKINY